MPSVSHEAAAVHHFRTNRLRKGSLGSSQPRRTLSLSGEDLPARIHFYNPFNRPPADRTESIVPGEHDAVLLWPVVAVGFVVRTLECTHLVRILVARQHGVFFLALFSKELSISDSGR